MWCATCLPSWTVRLLTVTPALVISRMDNCDMLYLDCPWRVPRTISWYRMWQLCVIPWRVHITALFCKLHWLPGCFWVPFKVIVFIFKALHGMGLDWGTASLVTATFYHQVKSVGYAVVPSPKELHLGGSRGHVFLLWLFLPSLPPLPKLSLVPSQLVFQKDLKVFFHQPSGSHGEASRRLYEVVTNFPSISGF